jgi:SHS2 domain-containing protein
MKFHGFEEVEHTADLAIRVWAADFYALLIHAALGMYDLMGAQYNPDIPILQMFELTNASQAEVLVDFLNELLFLVEESNQIFDQFQFVDENARLRIELTGYKLSSINRHIKAVTFHNLEISEGSKGLETTITFDV